MDGYNWYVYCGNNPIMYRDPTGTDYIVAWSYGKEEVKDFNKWLQEKGYTKELLKGSTDWTSEMWSQFDNRNSFARAAKTRKQKLIDMGIPENEIVFRRVDSSADFEVAWDEWAKIDIVEGLDFYSHGDGNGPEVHMGGTSAMWGNEAKLNWKSTLRSLKIDGKKTGYVSTPRAAFHGCNTANGAFAQEFADRQGVITYANTSSSSFSRKSDSYARINDNSAFTPVYLGVFKEVHFRDTLIAKKSRVPMKQFNPVR
jgi:hypothetical protein